MKKLILFPVLVLVVSCGDLFEKPGTTRNYPNPPNDIVLDCEAECSPGEQTENCLFVSNSVSRPEYKDRLIEFKNIVSRNPGSTIPKVEILELFDSPNDPCKRGDLIVSPELRFTNLSSEQCRLSYISRPLESVIGSIDVVIPKQISGRLNLSQDGYDLYFENHSSALQILMPTQALNDDYGGFVTEINVLGNLVLVQTQTACFAAPI
ncbi:hypothetical protein [Roseibium sp.]|uniref:hypothetical protein n=1 Tax=Roseibium sp. TaxID=1936156 RepID=UPI003BAC86CE